MSTTDTEQNPDILTDPFRAEKPIEDQIDAFPDLPTQPPVQADGPKKKRTRKPKQWQLLEETQSETGSLAYEPRGEIINAKTFDAAIKWWIEENKITEQGRAFIAIPAEAFENRRALAVTVGLV